MSSLQGVHQRSILQRKDAGDGGATRNEENGRRMLKHGRQNDDLLALGAGD